MKRTGLLKFGTILADNDATLRVENTHGRRVEAQARPCADGSSASRGLPDLSRAREAEAEDLTSIPSGSCAATTGSPSPASPPPGISRPCAGTRSNRPPCCTPALGADLVPPARDTAPLPQGPCRHPPGRARRPREKTPANCRHRAHARRTGRRAACPPECQPLGCRRRSTAPDHPTAQRPRALRSRLRRQWAVGRAPAAGAQVRSPRATTSITTASSSSMRFPRHRLPAIEPPRAADRQLAACRGCRILDRRRLHHRDRRRLFGDAARRGGWRIGIHIAAPRLRARLDIDAVARQAPGPRPHAGQQDHHHARRIVHRPSFLGEGRDCPAVSLCLDITLGWRSGPPESRVELVPIVANLRHPTSSRCSTTATVHNGGPDFPVGSAELTLLWDLATVLEAGRGKPPATRTASTSASVDWTEGPRTAGRVSIGGMPAALADGQARRRADDPRQHDLGQSCSMPRHPLPVSRPGRRQVRMTTVAAPQ